MRARFLVLLASLLVGSSVLADNRLPVPNEQDKTEAIKDVKEIFKTEYAKTTATARLAFARTLLDNAVQTKDAPATRYVLFCEARSMAAVAGDVALAMKAADTLADEFAVSHADARAPALEVLARVATTPAAQLDLAYALEATANHALAVDDLPRALKFIRLAGTAASKGKDVSVVAAVAARGKELETWQKDADNVSAALQTLKTSPDDPAASLLAGRYYCYLKGDWDTGLPLLTRSAEDALKVVAAKDLLAPTASADQVAVGDGWYDLAAGNDLAGRTAMRRRARHWYTEAAPELNGLAKIKVAKRLDELNKILGADLGAGGSIWGRLRTAVRDKTYTESALCGGAVAKAPFSDIPTEGGVLIGFHYILATKGLTSFEYLQPIYLTGNGEKLGKAYGNNLQAKPLTVKAKKGQAISGLTVRGGAAMDGFSVTFAPFDQSGWGMGDPMTTPWAGGNGGVDRKFGFDGSVIVGIHGKFLTGGQVGGLRVYTVALPGRTPKAK